MPTIELKLFATLSKFMPNTADNFEIPPGMSVDRLIEHLRIPSPEVHLVFVNNAHAERDKILQDRDRVAMFPAVGGG